MYENGKTAPTCEAVTPVPCETLKELIGKSTEITDEILELIGRMEVDLFGGDKKIVERPVVICYRDAAQYHVGQLAEAARKLEKICAQVGV